MEQSASVGVVFLLISVPICGEVSLAEAMWAWTGAFVPPQKA